MFQDRINSPSFVVSLSWGSWLTRCLLLFCFFCPCVGWSQDPPNIVFVLADDLGYTDLGYSGSRYYETPNIDRLAAEGIVFTNHHHCQNCTPTRAALMSGQHPARTGIYTVGGIDRFNWSSRPLRPVENLTRLPLNLSTIADQLKKAGYKTGMFGKWHIGTNEKYHPKSRGFDEAIETSGKHYDFETDPAVEYPRGQYLADFLTDQALGFIERNHQQPFFLYLPHFGVHSPHQAKPEWVEHFRKKPPSDGHRNATYAAMIASVDESVGRIMDQLDKLGIADNTIVLFASDNGGVGGYAREGIKQEGDITDNAPLRSGKGSLYEGGTRVPLIARWPKKIAPKSSFAEPTIHVDLYPTLLEIAKAPKPEQTLDGQSLVPWMINPTNPWTRDAIFQHFPGYLGAGQGKWRTTPVSTILAGNLKLMEFLEDGHLELYDLDRDIGETKNLAEEYPAEAQVLHERLVGWREEVGAKMPTENVDQK